jgi:hypothetical protein
MNPSLILYPMGICMPVLLGALVTQLARDEAREGNTLMCYTFRFVAIMLFAVAFGIVCSFITAILS